MKFRRGRFARDGNAHDTLIGNRHLVSYHDGDTVEISAVDEPVRFLLVAGKPLKEPIAWRGPIVMNTQAELRTAFAELDAGTFIKHPHPPSAPRR